MLTPDQLSAIRERLDAATPGPWELWYGEIDWVSVGIDSDTVAECRTHINHQFSGWQNLRNATFIQHAPTDLRALLDEVERLTVDPLPAAAWVREVERAAFARGAEAMRTAAVAVARKRANLPKHSDLDSAWCRSAECILDELRDLAVPEDR